MAYVVLNPLGMISNMVIVALAAVALNGALACSWSNFADSARAYAGVAIAVGALQLILGALSCCVFRDSVEQARLQWQRSTGQVALYEFN